MKKSVTITLISILLLQMFTGLFVNSEESDVTFVTTVGNDDEHEFEERANKEEKQDNRTEQDE